LFFKETCSSFYGILNAIVKRIENEYSISFWGDFSSIA